MQNKAVFTTSTSSSFLFVNFLSQLTILEVSNFNNHFNNFRVMLCSRHFNFSDSECISGTLYLYLKIFKTILMGLWTNKCDVTLHFSLNGSRVTFLSYRLWRSRQQRTRLQNGSTFVVPVYCCIHGFHSSSNPPWKGKLKLKYLTNCLD